MAGRNPQTQAKRARELALREKRDRKQAKKAERAAIKADGGDPFAQDDTDELDASEPTDEAESDR